MNAQEQQSAAGSVVHELAKPISRLLAWSSVALGAGALALATWRNVREG